MSCWDKPIHSRAYRWDPGKIGKSPGKKERILTKVSFLSSLSVVPGQNRKVKLHIVPSFPDSDCQEKKKKKRGYQSFLSQRELLPPCLSHLCPENLAWKLSGVREAVPKIWLDKCKGYPICSYKRILPKLICKELYLNGLKTNKHLYKSSLYSKIRELAQMLFKFMWFRVLFS